MSPRGRATRPGAALSCALAAALGVLACGGGSTGAPAAAAAPGTTETPGDVAIATFAGGCFWCMEGPFEALDGVLDVTSGYTGGDRPNPTYEEVSMGGTGHAEAVRVRYRPGGVSYERLLDVFWRNVDPLTAGAQFCDRGTQYRSAIFVHDEAQRRAAEASRQAVAARLEQPVVTEIAAAGAFYPAEESHQDYHRKNPLRYKFYRTGCGRDRRLREIWGDEAGGETMTSDPKDRPAAKEFRKPDETELKETLTPIQYQVTQREGTEPPFKNEYWDNHRHGIYVDVVSGEPLFSSLDKFDSGTGWPSFTRPLAQENVRERRDFKLIFPRREVRSAHGDSHLGHVFNDGPEPTGQRYCINSAALRFIPVERLEEEGYGEYAELFRRAEQGSRVR